MKEENKLQCYQIENLNSSKLSSISNQIENQAVFKKPSNIYHKHSQHFGLRANSSFYSNPGSNQKKCESDQDCLKVQLNCEVKQDKWKKLELIIKKLKFQTYVKKFLTLSRKRLYKLLNITQVILINDKASFFDFERSNQRYQKSIEQSSLSSNNKAEWMVFNPNNFFIEIWNFLKIICIIICFFFYLVSFAFSVHIQDILNPFISFGCQFYLAFDILVHLNTAIYLKGQLTQNRKLILQQFKSSNALYRDLFQVFTYFIYELLVYTKLTPLFFQQFLLLPIALKYQDLNNMLNKMKNKYIQKKETQNIFELINLIKNILFISHVFSCIWVLTAKIYIEINQSNNLPSDNDQQNFTTWIDLMSIQNESWAVQYLYSYYFIIVTMITVGYGDVRPTNPLEVGVCIVLMMTCCLVFGFAINQIGYIFQDIYLKEKSILLKRSIISNYMQKKQINSKIQNQVFEYLEYTWREELDEHQQEANIILSQLSSNLKQSILLESNKLILKQNRILKDNFDQQILSEIIPFIQEQNCTPGEIVIDNQIGNVECYIYFVQHGQLELFRNCQKSSKINSQQEFHSIKKIDQGDNFGQQSFFTGAKESLGVRSLNFSTLLKIKRSDFIQVLKQYQSDYENFCMIKDKIIFSGFYAQLNEKCTSCQERTHSEINCPILHYVPKKFKVLQQNAVNSPHFARQNNFERSIYLKKNSLKNLEYNVYRILQFIEEKSQDLDKYENEYLEYSFFKNQNTSMNDIEINYEKLLSHQGTEQIKPQFQKISSMKEEIMQKNRSKLYTFSNSNHLVNQKIEDENQQQQQHQNQSEEDSDQGSILKKINKKYYSSNSVQEQNSKLQTQEIEEELDALFYKQNQNSRANLAANQANKDGQYSDKIFKKEMTSEINNSVKVQIDSSIPNNQLGISYKCFLNQQNHLVFDVFLGKFESLQNFKNYYPLQNSKEILNKLNELKLNKRNPVGIRVRKITKNDNASCYSRRNNLFNYIKNKMKDTQRDQKTEQSQINQSFEMNSKQYNEFQQKINQNNSSHKLELSNQSNITNFEDLKVIQNNEVSNLFLNNSIKIELETPQFEEDQEHSQVLPSVSQCKRSYFADKSNLKALAIEDNQLFTIQKQTPFVN